MERNQVQWTDLHNRPIKFKRSAILVEVMVTIECFRFKEKYTSMQEGEKFDGRVGGGYFLLAIFDAVMNTMARANGKKVCRRTLHHACLFTLLSSKCFGDRVD